MLSLLFFSVLQLVLLAAWVSGYLDPYQKKLQEIILDTMGETKVSYGLKMSLTGKKLTEDQNLSKIQDQLGSQLGGVFGKGGLGEGLGSVLSKGL
ncbi:hypothetical protein LTR66_014178 [Elasticomyces elasticus]|nr:hypothetical protein LTR66_014178 [Elasticomyces elasticus]